MSPTYTIANLPNSLNIWQGTTDTMYYPPRHRPMSIYGDTPSIEVMSLENPASKVGTITREELVKYLEERRIREENELVRSLWERYQVALKLVRNSDDDDQGNQP